MREKLIELVKNGQACPGGRDPFGEHCENCPYYESTRCDLERLADYLIANGVTFATDNNVGSRWIPVTERLPEEHKLVLCLWIQMGDGFRYGFARLQRENVWWVLNEGMPEVTHWMPLPEAPKEVE